MTAEDTEDQSGNEESAELAVQPHSLSPDIAFKIIGNENRLAILDTLWGPEKSGSMAFADLKNAVGVRDSSQFNYHLKKLVDGGFVEKDRGQYTIRQAGARVICTVRTGYLTDHPEIDPFVTTGWCYACREPLEARYTDEMFLVECSACERLHTRMWFPPNGLIGRTPEEALLAAERAMRACVHLATGGICPVCNGTVERTLSQDASGVPVRPGYPDPDLDSSIKAWFVCRHCGAWATVSPGEAVVDHPAIVALYSDHGVEIRACPFWELPWTIDPAALEVRSEDPFRVQLTVSIEGAEQVLTLDASFDVVSVA